MGLSIPRTSSECRNAYPYYFVAAAEECILMELYWSWRTFDKLVCPRANGAKRKRLCINVRCESIRDAKSFAVRRDGTELPRVPQTTLHVQIIPEVRKQPRRVVS